MRLLCAALMLVTFANSAGEPKPAAPQIKEEELRRVPFEYLAEFPWKKSAQAPGTKPSGKEGAAGGDVDFSGMTSGELIIRAYGEFTREQKKSKNAAGQDEDKEILTLNKNVEIEQLQMKFVLRAQRIKIVQDAKTSKLELIEAQGSVEVWTPERSGRGEMLTYETRFGSNGEILRDVYTIEGDRTRSTRATLWQGDDVIEAERFVSDRRLDTFRVMGNPVALVSMPAEAGSAPAKPAAPAGGGMLPTFSLTGGGRVRLQSDGEIFYEGITGKVRITRNVIMHVESAPGQTAMKLSSDEATLLLNTPPPGQPTKESSLFSGSMKSIDFVGRVEIKVPGSVMLFDRGRMDLQKNVMTMEMKEPKGEVRIYTKDNPDYPRGFVYIAPKSLTVNLTTKDTSAGGPMRRDAFEGEAPTNRPKVTKEKDAAEPKK
ncbi:MAG TPA: hypothetical protein VEJ63_01070 [Planctomycetota bacterium]|nr:hypothetical protein [Planctomycetota bacterium]